MKAAGDAVGDWKYSGRGMKEEESSEDSVEGRREVVSELVGTVRLVEVVEGDRGRSERVLLELRRVLGSVVERLLLLLLVLVILGVLVPPCWVDDEPEPMGCLIALPPLRQLKLSTCLWTRWKSRFQSSITCSIGGGGDGNPSCSQ